MRYLATVRKDSQLPEFTGVSFTIRKFSHGSRTKLRMELAEALHKIREITERIQLEVERNGLEKPEDDPQLELPGVRVLPDEFTEAPKAKEVRQFTPEQLRIIDKLQDYSRDIDVVNADQVDPVYLRHSLVSVDGITDENGNPFTAETLYSSGPEDLCQEIVNAIKVLAGVSREEKANLELPTTSGAQVAGQMSDTNAPNAIEDTGTKLETAGDTSQT